MGDQTRRKEAGSMRWSGLQKRLSVLLMKAIKLNGNAPLSAINEMQARCAKETPSQLQLDLLVLLTQ